MAFSDSNTRAAENKRYKINDDWVLVGQNMTNENVYMRLEPYEEVIMAQFRTEKNNQVKEHSIHTPEKWWEAAFDYRFETSPMVAGVWSQAYKDCFPGQLEKLMSAKSNESPPPAKRAGPTTSAPGTKKARKSTTKTPANANNPRKRRAVDISDGEDTPHEVAAPKRTKIHHFHEMHKLVTNLDVEITEDVVKQIGDYLKEQHGYRIGPPMSLLKEVREWWHKETGGNPFKELKWNPVFQEFLKDTNQQVDWDAL